MHDDIVGLTEAHAALGGGGLAIFGSACLHTWPRKLEDVSKCFQNETLVDKNQFMDDSCYRGTYGGCFATTLGAVCHELCHTFDLGHTEEAQKKWSVLDKKLFNFFVLSQMVESLEDSKIDTVIFVNAAKEIVGLIEQFGKLFAPVKYDMNNNIAKIYSVYTKDKEKCKYLHDMILYEKQNNSDTGTVALQWLRRALHFVLKLFELIVESHKDEKKSNSLDKLFSAAYDETLRPYHGWMLQQLFYIICCKCPTRERFFQILACNEPYCDEVIISEMTYFNVNLKHCVLNLVSFYRDHKLETTERV
ncbi:uncharacterized protein CBL_00800 [Carabus blaptoides fortunei]